MTGRKLEKKSDANGVSNKSRSIAGKSSDLQIISGKESASETQGERGTQSDASELQGSASETQGGPSETLGSAAGLICCGLTGRGGECMSMTPTTRTNARGDHMAGRGSFFRYGTLFSCVTAYMGHKALVRNKIRVWRTMENI